jgi:hypothetical protein
MKKIITLAILTMMITAVFTVSALAQDMGPMNIADVLAEIRQEQGIGAADTIDVKKVSAGELEKLGDAVMELMIGNNALHEQMDVRLGGDGSANLTAFHTKLGYNYLSGYPNGMMNLMTGGMMDVFSGGMMGYFGAGGMMGYFGWGGLLFCLLLLIAIVVIIILAVKLARKPRS